MEDGNLYVELQQSAQNVLAGDVLDPLQAVVVPMSSVGAVHEKFKGKDGDTVECTYHIIYTLNYSLAVSFHLFLLRLPRHLWSF